jgi:hypothetical protein
MKDRLRGRDCFVALRAPRNDDGSVIARHIRRHCEPTGPAFGRPDDRLREAIAPLAPPSAKERDFIIVPWTRNGAAAAEQRIDIRCGLSRQLTRCLGVIAFEKARRERDRRRAPTAHGLLHEECHRARSFHETGTENLSIKVFDEDNPLPTSLGFASARSPSPARPARGEGKRVRRTDNC